MGEEVEVAIYSSQSKAYVDEVLRWIDGKNWCQYRFFNDGHLRGTLNRDTDYIYKKIKQSRTKISLPSLIVKNNSNGSDFSSPLPKTMQNQDSI